MIRLFETATTAVRSRKVVSYLFLCGVLTACGFHLRNAIELPEGMNRVYVTGLSQGSPFLPHLAEGLEQAEGKVSSKRENAGLILHAVNEQFLRREVSLSQAGKANMYELTYILTYDLQDSAGQKVLNQQTITVVRDYYNPQINIIGKNEEEGIIRKEMYQEAVRALLRSAEVALRNRAAAR